MSLDRAHLFLELQNVVQNFRGIFPFYSLLYVDACGCFAFSC